MALSSAIEKMRIEKTRTALLVFLLFHLDQLLSFIAYWHYSICKKVIQYAFWNGSKTEKAIKNVSISEILHVLQMGMGIPALQAVFTLTSATYAWYGTNNKVERQLSRRAVLHLYCFKEHRKGKSNFSYEKESENDRGKYLPKDHFFCNSIVSGKSVPAIV